MCRYLYAPRWRAGIINYAPTMSVFSLRLIVKNKVILSNRFADEPFLVGDDYYFKWCRFSLRDMFFYHLKDDLSHCKRTPPANQTKTSEIRK